MTRKRFTVRDARSVLARIGRKLPRGATLRDLARGMTVELEHRDVTHGDAVLSARIAMAHLRERPDYYALIDKLERAPARANPQRRKPKVTKSGDRVTLIQWGDTNDSTGSDPYIEGKPYGDGIELHMVAIVRGTVAEARAIADDRRHADRIVASWRKQIREAAKRL